MTIELTRLKSAIISKLESELNSKIDMHNDAIKMLNNQIDNKNMQVYGVSQHNNELKQQISIIQFEKDKKNNYNIILKYILKYLYF